MVRRDEGSGARTLYDEPISPVGRVFLQPELEQVIHCVLTFQNPFDVDAVKGVLKSSLINDCLRLRSLVVDIDNHVIIVPEEEEKTDDRRHRAARDSSPTAASPYSSAVTTPALRAAVPHALGDGVSLLGLVLASCVRPGNPDAVLSHFQPGQQLKGKGGTGRRRAEFSLAASVMGVAVGTWDDDRRWGGYGALAKKKLTTVALCLDDINAVKTKLNATVNYVFVGIISHGIAKYMKLKSSNGWGRRLTINPCVSISPQGVGQSLNSMDVSWMTNIGPSEGHSHVVEGTTCLSFQANCIWSNNHTKNLLHKDLFRLTLRKTSG
ncbi:unnamed protein product [Spirodela intermedia]|uniref:Uncharacterized protein n=1 Tax=Spirodela intermedia TaxID=51605 RepID=A0A7I8J0J2_SPIIN|nr:unnamed protein product [Spirodela intermedia]CAA6663648.1 unnamed protein product [Spirodela intermedia]